MAKFEQTSMEDNYKGRKIHFEEDSDDNLGIYISHEQETIISLRLSYKKVKQLRDILNTYLDTI